MNESMLSPEPFTLADQERLEHLIRWYTARRDIPMVRLLFLDLGYGLEEMEESRKTIGQSRMNTRRATVARELLNTTNDEEDEGLL